MTDEGRIIVLVDQDDLDELVGIVSYIDLLVELRVRVTAEELED